jgi:ABC-type antimicrobial peptide transport system permease subunit
MLGTWLMERKFNIDRMYIEALQVIGFILFSSVKFFFAPSTVYLVGYSYFETVAITVTGGILGVFVFFYTGSAIFKFIGDRFASSKPRRAFSRKNRLIIRVKKSWGLVGLALLSPTLISIPLGCLLAARYFRNDRRTIPFLAGSIVFWSFVLTSITALVGPLFD